MPPFVRYLPILPRLLAMLRGWRRPGVDDEQLERLIETATSPLREQYEKAAAEHRAAAVRLGRLEGQYAALVAQGWCKREAVRDHLLRMN